MSKKDTTLQGTTITKNRMEEMLRHSAAISGSASGTAVLDEEEQEVDPVRVAAAYNRARPNLVDDINKRLANRRRTEGVQGTSPTPGQDNFDYVPPTTSNVTNPGTLGGEDPLEEPADGSDIPSGEDHPNEQLMRDISTLFSEKKDDEKDGDDDEDDNADGEGEDDGDEDDGDGKDKNEALQVHCKECGYEEVYNLSEGEMEENPPPMKNGELDTQCPMCGADCDLSMMGATNQGEIGDPNPRTDPRGQSESVVPPTSLAIAGALMRRVAEGESVGDVAKEVIDEDFINHAEIEYHLHTRR